MGERIQSKKRYSCSFFDCKANFNKSWKLDAHICKHTGLKPFSCGSCDESFCTDYQLSRHRLKHSAEKLHKCQDAGCLQVFSTHAAMKNHVSRVHLQLQKTYKCDHDGCGKSFHKRNQLSVHKCEHTQLLLFHCSVQGCSRQFSSPSALKRHSKVHQGYPCREDGCSFRGTTWTELQKHKKKTHRIKLKCSECQKLFLNTGLLRLHRQLHAAGGKRPFPCPRQMFPCPRPGCDKSFSRRFNLQSHEAGDHDGVRAFICCQAGCGKSFAMQESLWRHGAAHDPDKKKLPKLQPKKPQRKKSSQSESGTRSTEAETSRLAVRLRNTSLGDPAKT